MIQPETRFATVGNDHVAYQVVGEGSRDILFTTGFWNHLDIEWEDPDLARFYRRLASFSRLIRFDRRGTGLSDRRPDDGLSAVEHWLQDCTAVLDAVRSRSPVFFGEGFDVGSLVLHYVDRHPDRCSGLIFVNTGACPMARPDYPEGLTKEVRDQIQDDIRRTWGTPESAAELVPGRATDESFRRWWAKLCRAMASPRAVAENLDGWDDLDCRAMLPRIRVPALVLAASHYFKGGLIEQSRYLARNITGARFVELPGADPLLCWLAPDRVDSIEEFVTGRRHGGKADHAIVTVLFTDIVDSTRRAAQVGNAAWRQLLDRHDQTVREQIAQHGGRLIDRAGDGTLATFDNPGGAIDCARALNDALKSLGIGIRSGLHTGEVELRDDGRVGGMAVHIGARIMSMACAGDVLVSHTVHGILMGSRYQFEERGLHELKGVPGHWPVFAATARNQP